MTWRCDITKNPVGTDTVMIGGPICQCQGCRADRQIDALQDQCAGQEIDLVNQGHDNAALRTALEECHSWLSQRVIDIIPEIDRPATQARINMARAVLDGFVSEDG